MYWNDMVIYMLMQKWPKAPKARNRPQGESHPFNSFYQDNGMHVTLFKDITMKLHNCEVVQACVWILTNTGYAAPKCLVANVPILGILLGGMIVTLLVRSLLEALRVA